MHVKEAIQTLFPGCYCHDFSTDKKSFFQIILKHAKGGVAYILGEGETEDEAWALAAVEIAKKFKNF